MGTRTAATLGLGPATTVRPRIHFDLLLRVAFGVAGIAALRPAACQVILSGTSEGADVIVQGGLTDGTDPVFRAIWRDVPEGMASFELQRTLATKADARLMLDRLIEAAIGAYLDARVHFTRTGVTTDVPSAMMVTELNAMMSAAIEGTGADVEFAGLSTPTREQLDRVTRIDWSQARFGVEGGAEQDKYLAIYYYVRSQREELERQLRADLHPMATVELLWGDAPSPGTTIRINSTCGTVFDEQNFLCALDLQLADSGGGAIDPELGRSIMQAMAQRAEEEAAIPEVPMKVRKRDRWLKQELDAINERIDRMDQRKELWELRDRMEDIEDRLTGVELDVEEIREEALPATDNPLANLSALTGRNITVHFERNSTALEPDQRVLLNEVFEQLARAPAEKVLITGYTDRSGPSALNLQLSEQRAKAVRHYLLSRGIDAGRLMVNYYGDSRSEGRDPGERRVEIEWLR